MAASNMTGTGGKTLAVNSLLSTASDCELQEIIIFRDFMVDVDVNMWVTQNIGELCCGMVCCVVLCGVVLWCYLCMC